jgi:hypothetical protein
MHKEIAKAICNLMFLELLIAALLAESVSATFHTPQQPPTYQSANVTLYKLPAPLAPEVKPHAHTTVSSTGAAFITPVMPRFDQLTVPTLAQLGVVTWPDVGRKFEIANEYQVDPSSST